MGKVPEDEVQGSVYEAHRKGHPVPQVAEIPKDPWMLISNCWDSSPDRRPRAWRCITQLRRITESAPR